MLAVLMVDYRRSAISLVIKMAAVLKAHDVVVEVEPGSKINAQKLFFETGKVAGIQGSLG